MRLTLLREVWYVAEEGGQEADGQEDMDARNQSPGLSIKWHVSEIQSKVPAASSVQNVNIWNTKKWKY